jgi:hypothetical protein
MLEGPYSNHTYHVNHPYKDYGLMKKFLTEGSKKGGQEKEAQPLGDDAKEKEDTFSEETGCLMIFSGLAAYEYKCR